MNHTKHLASILLTLFLTVSSAYAQDTIITVTKYYDYSQMKSYTKSWSIDSKKIKSINISSGEISIKITKWQDTFCFSNYQTLEPKLPKGVDPFSSFSTIYTEDSVVKCRHVLMTYDGEILEHPCNCFDEVFYTDSLDLDCIFSCELDTTSESDYINHYRRDGKLSHSLKYKDSPWLVSEKRTYDSRGNKLEEWTFCDSSSYFYDSLDRRVYQYFNYKCDKFVYFLETTYSGDSAITMGTQDGITRLRSIKTRLSDTTYLEENFFENGDILTFIYWGDDEEHPISEVTHKKNGDIETTDFQYIIRDDYYEKVTIRNGNQISKKTIQTFKQ